MNDNYIFDIKPTDGKSAVKAYADLTIVTERGEITVTGFKVIQKDDGEPFVVMPTVSFKDDSGNYRNVPKVSTSRLFQNYATETILCRYDEITP